MIVVMCGDDSGGYFAYCHEYFNILTTKTQCPVCCGVCVVMNVCGDNSDKCVMMWCG